MSTFKLNQVLLCSMFSYQIRSHDERIAIPYDIEFDEMNLNVFIHKLYDTLCHWNCRLEKDFYCSSMLNFYPACIEFQTTPAVSYKFLSCSVDIYIVSSCVWAPHTNPKFFISSIIWLFSMLRKNVQQLLFIV